MRIGISVTSSFRVDDPRAGARWMVERARAARQAGLDSLFVGDHHVTPSPYYQNTAILGRMLAEWGEAPVGALYLLPLWRGEEVTLSKHWPVRRARVSPLPPEPVEVWVGALAAPAIDRAARLAEGWLAAPGLTPAQAAQAAGSYREACSVHGRTPTAVAIRRDVLVGASSQEARRAMAPVLKRGYRGFAEEALLTGSVAEVADGVAALAEMGYTDVIVRNISSEQSVALVTIERLADVKAALA